MLWKWQTGEASALCPWLQSKADPASTSLVTLSQGLDLGEVLSDSLSSAYGAFADLLERLSRRGIHAA